VVITVVTRVRDDAALPFTITNLATLTNAENPTPRTAQATVVSAGQLPQTGEAGAGNWRIALIGLASAAAVYVSFRWFRSH
jgi:LPXTG-motif cell wall-anchored protein